MGSLADYIKELQTDYAKNNIYSQLGGSILGADVNVRGGSPYVNFATNLLKGLAGGGLNQMALADAREYNTGINSVFSDVLGGQSVRPIEGVSAGEVEDLTRAASLWQQNQDQVKKQLEQEIDLEGLKAEKVAESKVLGENKAFQKLGIGINPDSAQGKQLNKEIEVAKTKEQSFNFIDDAFEKAKGLVGASGALPSWAGGNKDALAGLGDGLIVQIDAALGRELNSDVRQRLLSFAPKWFDSPSQLEEKKGGLKALLDSLSAPTPTLDKLGASPKPISNTPKSSSSITPEQARALLRQKGIPGY